MELPTGTVTFWMTDIEGSTRLLQELGPRYADVLADHHAIIRAAVGGGGGTEVDTEGDAFFCVFRSVRGAVEAAAHAQRELTSHPWPGDRPVRVRMGLHTGEGQPASTGYVGLDVHRTARVAAAAHGGQVVVTATTRALMEGYWPPGVGYVFLGSHRLKDLDSPELLYQLVIDGLPARFPPLRSLEAPSYDLPSTQSSFVGRSREVAHLARLLEERRLITLTGPGGVGKTRLAVRTGAEVSARFPGRRGVRAARRGARRGARARRGRGGARPAGRDLLRRGRAEAIVRAALRPADAARSSTTSSSYCPVPPRSAGWWTR